MTELAALAIKVDSDDLEKATVTLKELPKAASAAERATEKFSNTMNASERAAAKWGVGVAANNRTADDFSKRVQRVVRDLTFEREQLGRSVLEQARYNAMKRAGVSEFSREGQAISAAVRSLQAERQARQEAADATTKHAAGFAMVTRALGPLVAGLSAAAVAQKVWAAAMEIGDLAEQAEQLGVSTDALQAYRFAAEQAGVSAEQLDGGLMKLTKAMGEANSGNAEMIEKFSALGVKLLDAEGNLRGPADVLPELSRGLLKVASDSQRNATMMDLMGKSGARMNTMLAEWAKGNEAVIASAKDLGGVASAEVIRAWDEFGDKLKTADRLFKVFVATAGAPIATTGLEAFNEMLKSTNREIELIVKGYNAIRDFTGVSPKGMQAEAAAVQGRIDKLHAAGADTPLRQAELQREYARLGVLQQKISDQMTADFTLPPITVVADRPGVSNPTPKGAGKEAENAAEKYAKLIRELNLAAEAQDKMTAAAGRGDIAFQEQEAALEAQQKLLDIYGLKLKFTDEQLKTVRDRLIEIAQGKAAQAFSTATNELQDQNVILQKQLDLMGQAPELIAKEIAALKVKQDVERAGGKITQEEIDRRTQVVETNERLKAQAEELRRANELWTAPLKSALESIQQTAADAFDSMLENGKISFESLAQTFTKILRRMAAEFLALATVRPVMSVIVNAIGGSGMAQQFGLSSGSGSLFGGSSSSFGMPSMGGGGIGGFLSPGFMQMPIFQSIDDEIANWATYGTAAQNSLGGVTFGQALGVGGGLLSMGLGLNTLLSGRGSTGSMIGGIGGMLGGGLGIAGALFPAALGGALGPIGMGVGLLAAMLPSLLGGESKPTITDQTYAQLRYSSGGWFTNGGAWGPNANSSQSEQSILGLGKNLDAVFALLGGVVDPQKVWGLSAQNRTDSGPDWSSSSLSSFLVSPSGNQQLWRMNDDTMWDTGSAQVAWRSIVEGAVGEISENMRNALTTVGQTSGGGMGLQAIAETIAQVKAFDDAIAGLGKTTTGVEAALMQIDAQFASLYDVATQFGFAVEQIDTAKLKARLEFATSFADSLQRGINDLTDPKINALADLDKWRDEAIKTNADILKNVTGSLDQINKIEELYGLQRAQILADTNEQIIDAQKQAGEAQIATLQDLIRSLSPGGALANVDPRSQLAGLEATYNATRSQARAGDQAAIDRFASDASAYAQFAKSFYGGSTDYNRIRDRIIGDATSLQMSIGAGWSSTPPNGVQDRTIAQLTSQLQQQSELTSTLLKRMDEMTAENARIGAMLSRLLANGGKAAAA